MGAMGDNLKKDKPKRRVIRRGEHAALDRMPSALHPEARVLHAPKGHGGLRFLRYLLALVMLLVLALGAALFALDRGYLDAAITSRAEIALDDALGGSFDARMGAARLRLDSSINLAIEADNLEILNPGGTRPVIAADRIRLVLDPMRLMTGRLVIDRIEIGHAELDARMFNTGQAIDWAAMRLDRVPDFEKTAYALADLAIQRLDESPAANFSMQSLRLTLPNGKGNPIPVVMDNIEVNRDETNALSFAGRLFSGGMRAGIGLKLAAADGKATGLSLHLEGIPLSAVTIKQSSIIDGPLSGLDAPLALDLQSRRPGLAGETLAAKVRIGQGVLFFDRVGQPLTSAAFEARYDRAKGSISLDAGAIDFGSTRIPFEGSLIDLDRSPGGAGRGLAFELIANDGIADTVAPDTPPLPFNAQVVGRYDFDARRLEATPISVSTSRGPVAATLSVTWGKKPGNPEIAFSMRADKIDPVVVKQLWPYWLSRNARNWVQQNLFDGTVTDGELLVLVPAGVMVEGVPTRLDESRLRIGFNVQGTRINYLGDLPPVRNAVARFDMAGPRIDISLASGAVFPGNSEEITLGASRMVVEDVLLRPAMAELSVNVSGPARALAAIAAQKPLEATQKTGFAADDFSGQASGTITARFGLVKEHNPPKPVYAAELALKDVALSKPVAGRTVSGLAGDFRLDAGSVSFAGKGRIDDLPVELAFSQPAADPEGKGRKLKVTGEFDSADISRFSPGLGDILGGTVKVSTEMNGRGPQRITADLGRASIVLPVIGWKKGAGIPAKVAFDAETRDGVTRISKFTLKGEGFGADGDIVNDKNGLLSAKFSRLQLTAGDRYQMSLKRIDGGYAADIRGNVADLRPIIASVKASTPESRKAQRAFRATVRLDNARGYNNETLSGFSIDVATSKGRITSVALAGVTRSGEAVVASKDDAEKVMQITSGDAGALFRFADVYRNMQGGLLNVKLRAKDSESWRGSIDVRNFALINEERLKSIVSTSGADGRSLNDAVKQEIDTSSQKFRRAFARVLVDGPAIRIDNGIVRGDEVGAVFQGAIRDESGRMELTGTFMPAYGLNRLFAELPLIGQLLGNGSDRGLLGITFKLAGPADSPKLSVNPLSLIAPGVFRNIFEFE